VIFLKFTTHSISRTNLFGFSHYIPSLRINRATIALVGSSFLIAWGVIDLQVAWQGIDAASIVFLLSMMVVNGNLAYAAFFPQYLWFVDSFNSR
jgi:Na+/H+ antiporter NhaD/arsenite permease-like protein